MQFFTYQTPQMTTGLDALNLSAALVSVSKENPVPEGTLSAKWVPVKIDGERKVWKRMLRSATGTYAFDPVTVTEYLSLRERRRNLRDAYCINVFEDEGLPGSWYANHTASDRTAGPFETEYDTVCHAETDFLDEVRLNGFSYYY